MILIHSSLMFLQTEKKLVAGIRLQYVSPKMERVFERIQFCFHETMSLAESSGPKEAEVIAAQPSLFQMKRYQKQHVGKSTVKVADPPPLTCREACDGNKQNEESYSFQNPPRKYLEELSPLTAKTVLLSALEKLSSNDWYVFYSTSQHVISSIFPVQTSWLYNNRSRESHLFLE